MGKLSTVKSGEGSQERSVQRHGTETEGGLGESLSSIANLGEGLTIVGKLSQVSVGNKSGLSSIGENLSEGLAIMVKLGKVSIVNLGQGSVSVAKERGSGRGSNLLVVDKMGNSGSVDPVGSIMGNHCRIGMDNSRAGNSAHNRRGNGLMDKGRGRGSSEHVAANRENWGNSGSDGNGWGTTLAVIGHDGLESINGIGGVSHATDTTVRVGHGIRTGHEVAVPGLLAGLAVTGLGIGHGVAELVGRVAVKGLDQGGIGPHNGGCGGNNGMRGGDSIEGDCPEDVDKVLGCSQCCREGQGDKEDLKGVVVDWFARLRVYFEGLCVNICKNIYFSVYS